MSPLQAPSRRGGGAGSTVSEPGTNERMYNVENPKIHHFDQFWTFQAGHPENYIFHNFGHFSRFPDFTERNGPGQINSRAENRPI